MIKLNDFHHKSKSNHASMKDVADRLNNTHDLINFGAIIEENI